MRELGTESISSELEKKNVLLTQSPLFSFFIAVTRLYEATTVFVCLFVFAA